MLILLLASIPLVGVGAWTAGLSRGMDDADAQADVAAMIARVGVRLEMEQASRKGTQA